MQNRKGLISLAVISIVTVLLVVDTLAAGPPRQGPDPAGVANQAGPVANKISYQGRLLDGSGNPANGKVKLVFQLWDQATGGDLVGNDIVKNNVTVKDGLFTVELDLPAGAFTGQARWLRIQVNGTWLQTRQELLAVPYAHSLRPGSSVSGGGGYTLFVNNPGQGVGLYARSESVAVLGNTTDLIVGSDDSTDVGVIGIGGDQGIQGLATETKGIGGYFQSGGHDSFIDAIDLALGGAYGTIYSDPAFDNSTLNVISHNDINFWLDKDGNKSDSVFRVFGTTDPVFYIDKNGQTTTKVLQITGGADLSEQFEIRGTGATLQPLAGMVVSIDPERPGKLIISSKAYDRQVAGIISGAGGIVPGMLMSQTDSAADGEFPVALTGRVYVMADASSDPIQPGDLLTTANTHGHAMKVTDYEKAQGAILGKAMSVLDGGQGLVFGVGVVAVGISFRLVGEPLES